MNPQATAVPVQPVKRHSNKLTLLRRVFYGLTLLSALIALILAAVVIGTQKRDFRSYNKSAAELLAASILALLILIPLHAIFHRTRPNHIIASTLVELATLFTLWLLFLGGAAALSHDFRNARCFGTGLCTQSRALRAFAWITFAFLTGLWAMVLATAFQAKRAGRTTAWRDEFASNAGERGALAGGEGVRGEKPVAQPAAVVA